MCGRIEMFDPVLAVHTSVVEPLQHQITAVYESMLPRQPLRFLLADDPDAGKTTLQGSLSRSSSRAVTCSGAWSFVQKLHISPLFSPGRRASAILAPPPNQARGFTIMVRW